MIDAIAVEGNGLHTSSGLADYYTRLLNNIIAGLEGDSERLVGDWWTKSPNFGDWWNLVER